MVMPKMPDLPPTGNQTGSGTITFKYKINTMKDIKVELVDVEDESTYTKPDYTVLIGVIAIVLFCGIVYAFMSQFNSIV